MAYVKIFTDGSCLGNPGRGGFGAILCCQSSQSKESYCWELWQGYRHTTNNRMELMAVIAALSVLRKDVASIESIDLTSDSKYLKDGITKWIHGWKKNGWLTAAKQPVKNVDLWRKLDQLVAQHQINWHWVKGHAGHAENERCDKLARDAAQSSELLADDGLVRFQHREC